MPQRREKTGSLRRRSPVEAGSLVSVRENLIERLKVWGVKRIYGYPGDGINGIIAALDRKQAAFMATAHAKHMGELGVCLATSGPGAIHLLNGLYDAKADHVPVLPIVGQAATTALGGDYQQEVDLPSLFKDVASEHLVTVPNVGYRCRERSVAHASIAS
jgi:pyruvate dehydrogenase (quinone)